MAKWKQRQHLVAHATALVQTQVAVHTNREVARIGAKGGELVAVPSFRMLDGGSFGKIGGIAFSAPQTAAVPTTSNPDDNAFQADATFVTDVLPGTTSGPVVGPVPVPVPVTPPPVPLVVKGMVYSDPAIAPEFTPPASAVTGTQDTTTDPTGATWKLLQLRPIRCSATAGGDPAVVNLAVAWVSLDGGSSWLEPQVQPFYAKR